jgi:hypothetical protein
MVVGNQSAPNSHQHGLPPMSSSGTDSSKKSPIVMVYAVMVDSCICGYLVESPLRKKIQVMFTR